MALYEHVYLARQDISPQQVEALTDSYKGVIEEHGGTVAKTEYWGLKSLTYRIKKNRKAHYTLINIDAPSAAVAEMERQMGISDDVIRHMTIRVGAHEDGPSAMVRSRGGRDRDRDRDDRRPRRDDRRDDRRDAPRDGSGAEEDAGSAAGAKRTRAARPGSDEAAESKNADGEAAKSKDAAASEDTA